nr:hypothetical protein [Tanacetum cinerariifolium]
ARQSGRLQPPAGACIPAGPPRSLRAGTPGAPGRLRSTGLAWHLRRGNGFKRKVCQRQAHTNPGAALTGPRLDLQLRRHQLRAHLHVLDAPRVEALIGLQAHAIIVDGQLQTLARLANVDDDAVRHGVLDRIVDGFLNDPKQRDLHRLRQAVAHALGAVLQPRRDAQPAVAHAAPQQVLKAFFKPEQLQHRWLHRVDELPQLLHAVFQRPRDPAQVFPRHVGQGFQAGDAPMQAGQVGEGLVVQVHADPLTLALQLFGQAQCTLTQPLFTGAHLGLGDRQLLGLLGLSQGIYVGGQQIGDVLGVANVIQSVEMLGVFGATQRADDFTARPQRHMQAAAQTGIEDRVVDGAGKGKPGIVHRIRVHTALIGDVLAAIEDEQAYVEVIVGQDRADLPRDGVDHRLEIQLAGQGAGDAEKVVQHVFGGANEGQSRHYGPCALKRTQDPAARVRDPASGLLHRAVERRRRGCVDDDGVIALQDHVLDLRGLLGGLVFGGGEGVGRLDQAILDRLVGGLLPAGEHQLA